MKILRTLTHWPKPEWWDLPIHLLLSKREGPLLHGDELNMEMESSFTGRLVKGLFEHHSGRC